MAEYTEALKVTDLSDGQMMSVDMKGHEILVARLGDRFYATGNICPHMGGKLAQGRLEGTVVTCPRHGSQFDLRDGHVVRWTNWPAAVSAVSKLIRPPRPIDTYPVKVDGDRVLVEI